MADYNERLELAMDAAEHGFLDWNFITDEVYFSPAYYTMLGYEVNELPMIFDTFNKLIHPEDKIKVMPVIRENIDGGKPFMVEFRLLCKDGNYKWIAAKGKSYFKNTFEKPYRIIGINIDIDERKRIENKLRESEERLSLTFDITGEGIWDWNIKTDEISHNKRWCEILGLDDSMLRHPIEFFKERIHPLDRECVLNKVRDSIVLGVKYVSEHRMICSDGSIIWVLDRGGVTSKNESGEALRMTGSIADITERKKIEEMILLAKEDAEKASHAKSEFLANMSHEIRTPLNAVIGFNELLLQTPLNEIQKQYADNANISAKALLGIINDILDLSKIEAGKLELDILKTDIIELIEQTADIIKYHSDKKGLEFLLDIPPDMPRFAEVDPVRLKQIIINLLNNAVKFTEKGEIELKVVFEEKVSTEDSCGVENYDANDKAAVDKAVLCEGRYEFSVRDTGIGITDEQKSNLFKSFSQADNSTTRKFGGTGLGLIISNLLAEKMGSEISLKSEYGKGSVFKFYIETVCYKEFKNNEWYKTPIKSVLVIDDNENNRLILEHNFKYWKIDFKSCDNGLSALKILESYKFDLLIVDYNMPYLNGIETIKMIKKNLGAASEKIFIILIHSSLDDKNLCDECKESGIKFNFIKPVKSIELFKLIKNLSIDELQISVKESEKIENFSLEADVENKFTVLIAEDVEMNMILIKTMVNKFLPDAEILEAVNGKEAVKITENKKIDLILMDVQMPEMDGIQAAMNIRAAEFYTGGRIPIIALTAGAFKEEKEKCLMAGMDDFIAKPIETGLLKRTLEKYKNFKTETTVIKDKVKDKFINDTILSFDKKGFMDKIDYDKKIFKELIDMSFSEIKNYIYRLENLINERKMPEIKKVSHSLKGLTLTFCFNRIAQITLMIENNLETDFNKVNDLYLKLKAELFKVEEIIKEDNDLR